MRKIESRSKAMEGSGATFAAVPISGPPESGSLRSRQRLLHDQ
jgi:hypothetical protein